LKTGAGKERIIEMMAENQWSWFGEKVKIFIGERKK
jgi:hypothetical protein